MSCEDKVRTEFARVAEAFGIVLHESSRRYSGAGEGALTYTNGSSYCTADWWEHGCLFTLFLGLRFEVEGRMFVSEFPVSALEKKIEEESEERPEVEVQSEAQFRPGS